MNASTIRRVTVWFCDKVGEIGLVWMVFSPRRREECNGVVLCSEHPQMLLACIEAASEDA